MIVESIPNSRDLHKAQWPRHSLQAPASFLRTRSDKSIFEEVRFRSIGIAVVACAVYDLVGEVGVVEKRDRAVMLPRIAEQRPIVGLPQRDPLRSRQRLALRIDDSATSIGWTIAGLHGSRCRPTGRPMRSILGSFSTHRRVARRPMMRFANSAVCRFRYLDGLLDSAARARTRRSICGTRLVSEVASSSRLACAPAVVACAVGGHRPGHREAELLEDRQRRRRCRCGACRRTTRIGWCGRHLSSGAGSAAATRRVRQGARLSVAAAPWS